MITLEEKLNSFGIEFFLAPTRQRNSNAVRNTDIYGVDWHQAPADILPLHLVEDEKVFLQIHFDKIICEQIYNGQNPIYRIAEIMNIRGKQKLDLEDYIEHQVVNEELQEGLTRISPKDNWIGIEAFKYNSNIIYIPKRPFSFFEDDKVITISTNEDKIALEQQHYSIINNISASFSNNQNYFPVYVFTKIIKQLPDVFVLDHRYKKVKQARQYLVQLDDIKDPYVLVIENNRSVFKRLTFTGISDVLLSKQGESYTQQVFKVYDSKRHALSCIYDIYEKNIESTKELLEKHLKLQKEIMDEINEVEKQEKVYFKGVLLG